MIPAIVIGRGGSKGFPRKNEVIVNNRRMMQWPIFAAQKSGFVTDVYFSTEDNDLSGYAFNIGAKVIQRPPELATDAALGEDAFLHAYQTIKANTKREIISVVLMFANAPCINGDMIDAMITRLYGDKTADSICSVSKYNMYSPYRARLMHKSGLINFINSNQVNCDRNSTGDFYFYDCSCAVVRPHVMDNLYMMPGPQPWLGRRILHYVQQIPALDVDYEWQLGQVEYWLQRFSGGGLPQLM